MLHIYLEDKKIFMKKIDKMKHLKIIIWANFFYSVATHVAKKHLFYRCCAGCRWSSGCGLLDPFVAAVRRRTGSKNIEKNGTRKLVKKFHPALCCFVVVT